MNLLRKGIAVIVVISTLSSMITVPLIQIDYNLRKDYIADVLCINRDRPVLQCHGKCFLAKQMAKAKKQQKEESQTGKKIEILSFLVTIAVTLLSGAVLEPVTRAVLKQMSFSL